MGKFIKLGVDFGRDDLPQIIDYPAEFAAIASLKGWIDGRAGNYTDNGSGILTFRDLSPAGVDWLKPGTRTYSPTISDDVTLNGDPVIEFAGNGGDTGGLIRGTYDVPVNAKFTKVVVAKIGAAGGNQMLMANGYASTDVTLYSTSGGLALTDAAHNNSISRPGTTTDWFGAIASYDASAIAGAGNGVHKLADSRDWSTVLSGTFATASTMTAMYLGQSNGETSLFVGYIAMAMLFYDDLFAAGNEAALALVQSYIADRYGLGA